jgi:hypothetical protein
MTEKARKKEGKEEKAGPLKKEEKKNGKTCFVISPIDKPESEIRKRSDQVFKHVIGAVVEPIGYRPIRADQIAEPGIITSQVIQCVVDSPLVVADLTGRNPNVFYELAIRHAIRKPLIQLIKAGEQIPFDVAGTRTINIDINDLDSVEQAKKELAKQIESIEKGKIDIDSPISVALDLKILKESGNPEQRSLADVVGALSELRASVIGIEKKVNNPESLIPPGYFDYCMRRVREVQPEIGSRVKSLSHEINMLAHLLRDDKKSNTKEKQMLMERILLLASRLDSYLREM